MMENPLFITTIPTGLIFIILGFVLLKFPPQKINGIYGYRTVSSMRSQERWDFAQIYASRELIKLGALLLLCGLTGLIFHLAELTGMLLGFVFLISTVVSLVIRVESAIKSKFEKNE